ncbi:hypothetical protein BSP38_201 [Bacillus phage BSP38]|uniref:Uncharacterized protein n=1 Tax=Bacillus phage BSP38 TaxID=2283013 RepID=A0A345MK61_BPBSP|nr:hypothetical protein HWB82_gp117 [Bacillus phage BSP38]AXH71243.1 hypothetical protein BSP38_201 [Bacillus phage BSP38]
METNSKVVLCKTVAKALQKQIDEASDFLRVIRRDSISEFLIRIRTVGRQGAEDMYDRFFSGEFGILIEQLGYLEYIDALRVGIIVKETLEEKYLDKLRNRIKAYNGWILTLRRENPGELSTDALTRLKFLEGQKDEAESCMHLFKNYLAEKEIQEKESE